MKLMWLGALAVGALVFAVGCSDGDDEPGSSSTSAPSATATSAPSAAAAALDTSFGTNGIANVALSTTEHDRFMATAIAQDGSIFATGFVSLGGDQAMALAKFQPTGARDNSFGENGVAIVNVAAGGRTAELARGLAIFPNGKIVIAGPIEHDTSATGDAARDTDIGVVRFDSTGKPDPTFGTEGIARIDLGTGRATSATAFVGDNSWGVGALAGDKIAILGSTPADGDGRTDSDLVLFVVGADGERDMTFGEDGAVVVNVKNASENPRNLTVQADGKIVGTGYASVDGVVVPILFRTSATGQLDTAFGEGGIAYGQVLPGVTESYAASVQGDKYISAGYGRGSDNTEKVDLIVDRWNANGTLDTTFGTNGYTRLDLAKEDDRARNVVALAAMIVLMSKDGELEAGFGTGGYILSDLGGPADSWYGLSVSPDGAFAIVAGYKGVDANSGGNDDAVLARIKLK